MRHPFKQINQVEPYITENEVKAVDKYLRSGGWLTEFDKTREFERMIADFLGVKHAVVVTSGTVGIYLSLLGADISNDDSVVVPDYTMIASPNAVKWAGGNVVLCDVEKNTLCLDLNKMKLAKNTKGVMYVAINGRSGDMGEVVDYCKDNQLYLIEDACQAFGSKWRGKFLGTFGDVGIFSINHHKIITTGQGGVVVTNRNDIYEKVSRLKDFYRIKPGVDIHEGVGFNFKFTDLQAVIGIEQLKTIDFRIRRKKEIYRQYVSELEESSIEFLPISLDETVPWFVDVLLKSDREATISFLKDRQIGTRPFYPPIHTQTPYLEQRNDFPITSSLVPRGLWLPSSIGITSEEISRVTTALMKLSA